MPARPIIGAASPACGGTGGGGAPLCRELPVLTPPQPSPARPPTLVARPRRWSASRPGPASAARLGTAAIPRRPSQPDQQRQSAVATPRTAGSAARGSQAVASQRMPDHGHRLRAPAIVAGRRSVQAGQQCCPAIPRASATDSSPQRPQPGAGTISAAWDGRRRARTASSRGRASRPQAACSARVIRWKRGPSERPQLQITDAELARGIAQADGELDALGPAGELEDVPRSASAAGCRAGWPDGASGGRRCAGYRRRPPA